ncbi:universal stress protein [Aristophania vespae]|uniref:Universal stress protein n=1 Tax=Aristophania vespae TaxID=2697033 RepID=A0A6P1NB82_9PROT|nr:universal stress protein [Aristophania vespae]QHI95636.1 universal stress protein [Aristophania vespae]UMM63312.1 hypothetical protein DM15PD_02700 [Aristophania vespae]
MNVETRNILLPLTTKSSLEAVFHSGFLLAKRYRARISCIFFSDRPGEIAAMAGEGMAAGAMGDMIENAVQQAQQNLEGVRHYLNELQKKGKVLWFDQTDPENETALPSLQASAAPQVTLKFMEGTVEDVLTWQSRLADIILVPHLVPSEDPNASDILHAMLYDGSQPVIISPPHAPKHIGNHIAIAWNGTAESALALRNVLPWARRAEKVTVLSSPDYQRIGPAAEAAIDYLNLHGVVADLKIVKGKKRKIGESLLQGAHEVGADLLSMGAYSHSRLRQRLLGGVTRYMLENADMTIMMSR